MRDWLTRLAASPDLLLIAVLLFFVARDKKYLPLTLGLGYLLLEPGGERSDAPDADSL